MTEFFLDQTKGHCPYFSIAVEFNKGKLVYLYAIINLNYNKSHVQQLKNRE